MLTIGTSILAIALVVIYLVLRRTPHLTEKDAVVIRRVFQFHRRPNFR